MDEVTSPRRARPLEPLVSKALELRDAGRADWLTEACQDDPEAAAEVRAVVERAALLPDMVRSAATRDPLIGRSLGERYRVVERLGAGAMGIVYLAEDQELRRRVACKVVRHGLMAPAQALERFAREARAMAAVQHPSVITIYDRGRTDEDEVYIVMELIEGAPLGELIEAAAGRDGGELLKAAKCRVAIIRGEESALMPDEVRDYMRSLLGHQVPFVSIPHARHHVMLDQPVAFISALRMLLAEWDHSDPHRRV